MKKILKKIAWITLATLGCLAIITAAYMRTLHPSNEGPWTKAQALLPYSTQNGREITFHHIRDFRYSDSDQSISSKLYLNKTYSLDELQRVWLGLSHFGPYGLAHSFLSFEFANNQFLVISVEARLRPGDRYAPFKGLFRQFTKIYIASSEEDVIGLRSHIRKERVLLYPIEDKDTQAIERLLLSLTQELDDLHDTPAFYNTILDNCLTNLLKHSERDMDEISATDLRVLLPGRVDRLTYAFGITPDEIPFQEARQRAQINPELTELGDSDFSSKIRCGWNGYKDLVFPGCP